MEKPPKNRDPNDSAFSEWRAHMVEVEKHPWLVSIMNQQGDSVQRRFFQFYSRLRKQPRRTRRLLQARISRKQPRSTRRFLPRKMSRTLVGAALVLALSSTPVHANTINVDGINCTLVDAVTAANTDTVSGGCIAGSGPDTIVLEPGSTHTLVGPSLPISSQITIEGNGAIIERSSGADPLSVLTIEYGDLTLNNATITGGADGPGGGMIISPGTVTINESVITGNTALEGGGIYCYECMVTIRNSTISGNTANKGGGMKILDVGTVTIENSTIANNVSVLEGGGVSQDVGGYGDSSLTISNSTISGNTTDSEGGGVFSEGGSLTISNSTITGNTADVGGGIYAYSYEGNITLNQSLISGNTATSDPEVFAYYGYAIDTDNHNLFGYNGDAGVSFTPGGTNIVPGVGVQVSDILDTNLADNGGATQTHALVAGSPGIDAIPSAFCSVPTDQRGISRPQGEDCDIGAFELEQAADNTPVGTSVEVDAGDGVVITFGEVTEAGNTTAIRSTEPPQGSPSSAAFQFLGEYFEITTTATYESPVTVAISYDDSGLSQAEEESLVLFHYDEGLQEWIDITDSVDTDSNVIKGVNDSLSNFAAAIQALKPTLIPPLHDGTTAASPDGPFKCGRTLPVKCQLLNLDGQIISDSEAQQLEAHLRVSYESSFDQGTPFDPGDDSPDIGDEFRYDDGDDLFIHNLSTKKSSLIPDSLYKLEVFVDGIKVGHVFFSLR